MKQLGQPVVSQILVFLNLIQYQYMKELQKKKKRKYESVTIAK